MHQAQRLPAFSLPEVETHGRAPFPSAWREVVAAARASRDSLPPNTRPLPSFRLSPSYPSLPAFEPDAPSEDRSQYEMLVKIGAGGTSSVFVGRFTGAAGFSRLFAIKRAHPHLLDEPAAQQMLVTEARLASRIHHANVVAVHDVERCKGEVLLVMEYIEGSSLSELVEAGNVARREIPYRIAIRIALDACAGLSAVHELTDDDGQPLDFIHRDVSPQNILVGIDGTSRIADFGLAKLVSAGRASGCLNGKLAYLAPEVIDDHAFSVQSDVFAMGVVLWEALANQRLFRGYSEADTVRRVGLLEPAPLSKVAPELGTCLDNTIAKALAKNPERRYGSVRELAAAVEGVASRYGLIATSAEVSRYAQAIIGDTIERRRRMIRHFDGHASSDLLFQETVSIVPGNVIPLRPYISSSDSTPVHTRSSSEDLEDSDVIDASDIIEIVDEEEDAKETQPTGAMVAAPNDDDITTRHSRESLPPAREKPKPPLKEQKDEAAEAKTEKSDSGEIPVVQTGPIEATPPGGKKLETSGVSDINKIVSTDDRRGLQIDKELLARAAALAPVIDPSEEDTSAARRPRMAATQPSVERAQRLAAEAAKREARRQQTTVPPATLRATTPTASSSWLRVGLASLVAVELLLVLGVVGGWIPRPGGAATIQPAPAAAPTQGAPEVTTSSTAAATAEHAAAPVQSASSKPSAQASASAPPPAPKPVWHRRVAAPKPADTEEPSASDATSDDDARPTNTNPLSRAKRHAAQQSDDDSSGDSDSSSAPAKKAPPNPYK